MPQPPANTPLPPPPAHAPAVVACDFDGTITCEDLGVATMQRFAHGDWWSLELAWRNREIDTVTCMQRQFAMVEASEAELRTFYQQAPVDEGFVPFVQACRRAGVDVVVLSDGLDLYIHIVLARLGLADLPCHANHAWFEAGRLRLAFPHRSRDDAQCGNCKRSHVDRLAAHYAKVAYVGDGFSDRCVVEHARPVFAKSHLAEYCQAHALAFTAFTSFADLLSVPAALATATPGPPPRSGPSVEVRVT